LILSLLVLFASSVAEPRIEPVGCARFAQVEPAAKVECGYLRVAEDRDVSSSRTIGVPFAVVHNAHRTSDDPLVMIAGGPGGRVIPRKIRHVSDEFGGRDVVFFEQRGTDLADQRLDCRGYAEEKQKAQLGIIDGRELARGLIKVARRCVVEAGRRGVSLSGYTTRAIVADLEDFRRLQGYSRINLVGVSYAGKVIFEYARDHPDHTRAVVANTPLTLEANYDEQGQSAMRRTLDLIIAGCEREPACDDAHPNLDRKFRDLVERAATKPWLLDIPDPDRAGGTRSVRATPWVVANALLDQLYSPDTFELVPARIDAIWVGNRKALSDIIDIGKSTYPWLMRLSLWCNEEVPFEDSARVAADLFAYPEFARVDQATIPIGLCKAAGIVAHPPETENQPVRSDVPFLIFSGVFDPATPPTIQRSAARSLTHSTLVLFPSAGHGAGFSACGGRLIGAFIADPGASLDATCVRNPAAPDFTRSLK
jgi:pimeloyl-ACP methyl ester carboxylesterase